MRMVRTLAPALALILALAAAAHADVKGSHDSPLVSRYAGSTIIGYQHSAYGMLLLPLGKASYDKGFAVKRKVEGELTRIIYVDPPRRSPLEVFANYRNALTKAGFKILFSCDGDECGKVFHQKIYPQSQQMHQSQQSEFAFSTVQDQHFLAAELDNAHGTVTVALYVVRDINDAGVYKGPSRHDTAAGRAWQADAAQYGHRRCGRHGARHCAERPCGRSTACCSIPTSR